MGRMRVGSMGCEMLVGIRHDDVRDGYISTVEEVFVLGWT